MGTGAMVTFHPVVIYYKDENREMQHKSFVFVSDELSHNSTAVLAILEKLTTEIKSVVPEMKFIHYWTDSPTSHYRNKTIFATVANHGAEFGVPVSWNYFEAGHGKALVMVKAVRRREWQMKLSRGKRLPFKMQAIFTHGPLRQAVPVILL